MNAALLAVPVEIRALDVGARVDRVFRLTHSIAEDGVRFVMELPYEPGRPVRIELTLPDDEQSIRAEGRVERPDLVSIRQADADVRQRIARYVGERNLFP